MAKKILLGSEPATVEGILNAQILVVLVQSCSQFFQTFSFAVNKTCS